MRAVVGLAMATIGIRPTTPKPPEPDVLEVGNHMPYADYRDERCCAIGGHGDFPPRCSRVKGHDGNHAAGEAIVLAVWP